MISPNGLYFVEVLWLYPLFHFGKNRLRFLIARVVGSEDDIIAEGCSDISHYRAFAFVAIAPTAHYSSERLVVSAYIVDGFQHVFKGIGGMSIIYDGNDSRSRYGVLKAPCYKLYGADKRKCIDFINT